MPGITAVVRLKDDGAKVRFVGDALAAVSGRTLDDVRDAIEKIQADYEADEHNVDYLMDEDAPLLDMNGQVDEEWPESSKIEDGLSEAAQQHVATYRTEVQTHSSLETHGSTNSPWASLVTTSPPKETWAPATGRPRGSTTCPVRVALDDSGRRSTSVTCDPGTDSIGRVSVRKPGKEPTSRAPRTPTL